MLSQTVLVEGFVEAVGIPGYWSHAFGVNKLKVEELRVFGLENDCRVLRPIHTEPKNRSLCVNSPVDVHFWQWSFNYTIIHTDTIHAAILFIKIPQPSLIHKAPSVIGKSYLAIIASNGGLSDYTRHSCVYTDKVILHFQRVSLRIKSDPFKNNFPYIPGLQLLWCLYKVNLIKYCKNENSKNTELFLAEIHLAPCQ